MGVRDETWPEERSFRAPRAQSRSRSIQPAPSHRRDGRAHENCAHGGRGFERHVPGGPPRARHTRRGSRLDQCRTPEPQNPYLKLSITIKSTFSVEVFRLLSSTSPAGETLSPGRSSSSLIDRCSRLFAVWVSRNQIS